ncbi:MAG: hypothetical protein H0Z16_06715 [Thermodesulfobacterium sp.]|nr:hypothetical protein [Thermodesulfobacterium sp.]
MYTSIKVIKKPKINDKMGTSEEAPIPSRGEPGLHEVAAESSGPQETSSVSTNNKLIQETPSVKFKGEGWIIVPSEKGKFRVAFEDSELERPVKDALYSDCRN